MTEKEASGGVYPLSPRFKELVGLAWGELVKQKVVNPLQVEQMIYRGVPPPIDEKQRRDTEPMNRSLSSLPELTRQRAQFLGESLNQTVRAGNYELSMGLFNELGEMAKQDKRLEEYLSLKENQIRSVAGKGSAGEAAPPPEPPKSHRESPPSPEPEPPAQKSKRKPRVSVYLGMIPELKQKLVDQGINLPGDRPERHVMTPEEDRKEKFLEKLIAKGKLAWRTRKEYQEYVDQITNPDVALYNVLLEINEALAENSERWEHSQGVRIDIAARRFRDIVGRNDRRYKELKVLKTAARNVHKYDFEVWKANRGGRAEDIQKILAQASAYVENGAFWILMEDPEVEQTFHEGKGMFSQDVDFVLGRKYEWTDPNTGEKRDVEFKGGDYGGAERVGVFFRWLTMVGHYDGYAENAAKAYTSHRIRWWHKYALGKGWMHGAKRIMYEYIRGDDKRLKDVRLHSISAWPHMFLAPNQTTEIWHEKLEHGLKTETGVYKTDNGIFDDEGTISWEDKGRLLINYGSYDERSWTYTREEFENPLRYLEDQSLFGRNADRRWDRQREFLRGFMSEAEINALTLSLGPDYRPTDRNAVVLTLRRSMFKKAVGIWSELGLGEQTSAAREKKRTELQQKILRNTMINDRWIMNFDLEANDARIGVRPVVDVDAKDKNGEYRLALADFFYGPNGTHLGRGWANNTWTYESYAVNTEVFWENLSRTSVADRQKIWENLIKVASPKEAYRHLYGEIDEKTRERKGMLDRYYEEINWLMECFEAPLLRSVFEQRENGLRLKEVFQPLNEFIRIGMLKKFYQLEFAIAGLKGLDWTIMDREPIEPHQIIAKVLSKMNDRDVWINFMNGVLAGTDFANLTPEQKWQAIVTYAGFKIDQNAEGNEDGYFVFKENIKIDPTEYFPQSHEFWKKDPDSQQKILRHLQKKGRVVHYYNMSLDKDRTWGRGKFGADTDKLMTLLDEKISTNPMFGYFVEVRNEHKIICQLIDAWVDHEYVFNPAKQIKRKYAGGLPINYHTEEIMFNEKLRDMRYALGNLQGKDVLEQLLPDKRHKVFVDHQYNGRTYRAYGYRLALQDVSMKDHEGKLTNINLQPIYPMFHFKQLSACQGQDVAWSIAQGTGEHHAGMDLRLTPGYLFFDRNRYMKLLVWVTADPFFRNEAYINSNKDWEIDKGWELVADPILIDEVVTEVGTGEGDPNWEELWHRLTNSGGGIEGGKLLNYRRRSDELFIPLFAKKGAPGKFETEQDLKNVQSFAESMVGAIPLGPLKGSNKDFIQWMFGRNGKETQKNLILGGPPGIIAGVGTGVLAVGALGSAGPLVAVFAAPLAALTVGRFTVGLLGGDGGVEGVTHLEMDQFDDSILAEIRRGLVKDRVLFGRLPMSMMGERKKARSFREMAEGMPFWDSISNMKGWAKHLFDECKPALVNEIQKT